MLKQGCFRVLLTGAFVTLSPVLVGANPQQEREDLMRSIGIAPETPHAVPEKPTPDVSNETPPTTDQRAGPDKSPPPNVGSKPQHLAPTKKTPVFVGSLHAEVIRDCYTCHSAQGPAKQSHLVLNKDANDDYKSVSALIDRAEPAKSVFLTRATGEAHPPIWGKDHPVRKQVMDWIAAGAQPGPTTPKAKPKPVPTAAAVKRNGSGNGVHVISVGTPKTQVPNPATPSTPDLARTPRNSPLVAAAPPFTDIHSGLVARCASCHSASGVASTSGWLLEGSPKTDFDGTRAFLKPGHPGESSLWTKALGERHGGGASLKKEDAFAQALRQWIALGAEGPKDASTSKPTSSGYERHGGIGLPGGFRLNGRFDVNYERRGYNGNPGQRIGRDSIRSYHHFLFLSRSKDDEPVSLVAELTELLYWEARYKHRWDEYRFEAVIGKLLVPFGADPLFHQAYGGLVGFDQLVLPSVWTRHGAGAQVQRTFGDVFLKADLYAIQGYRLDNRDDVINLQNDFASNDNVKVAFGQRISARWKGIQVWYSMMQNPLGFDRVMLLQALDAKVRGPSDIEIVRDITVRGGLLRGDFSGAGDGRDYYHFASYLQVEYQILDWLTARYRQGFRSFDNRRRLILDRSRQTSDDGSTHHLGLVFRHHGIYGLVGHYWNLERADEIPNDFLRLTLGFGF